MIPGSPLAWQEIDPAGLRAGDRVVVTAVVGDVPPVLTGSGFEISGAVEVRVRAARRVAEPSGLGAVVVLPSGRRVVRARDEDPAPWYVLPHPSRAGDGWDFTWFSWGTMCRLVDGGLLRVVSQGVPAGPADAPAAGAGPDRDEAV